MTKFLGVIRAPFLLLVPACISLAVATALLSGLQINWINLVIATIAALAASSSVNALNEYLDFKNGLDAITVKTPFSGGSGTLVKYPEFADATLRIAVIALLVSIFCGLYLVYSVGFGLLPLGLVGTIIIVTYTSWINLNALICLVAPGLAFGPIMVIGTHYALVGEFSVAAIWASCVPFFFVNNLLLLNQFPDVEADQEVGRRHLAIILGRYRSSAVFGLFFLAAYSSILLAVILRYLPPLALLGMISAPVAVIVYTRVRAAVNAIPKLVPTMGLNVLLTLSTPILLAIGLWASI